ncbi:MAG: nucleotidyltransferase substrate binding protein [Candidatus Coatesbacteria bacterium]
MALDLTSFEKAARSFEEVLLAYDASALGVEAKERKFLRDAVIQRFEYTFELARKFLRRYLEMYGLEDSDDIASKDLFRLGFEQGMVRDAEPWLEYLKKRNITSHTYDEVVAEEVLAVARRFLPDVKYLLEKIRERAVD